MTVKGRTTPRWGRDRSARWDSSPENGFRTRSYPPRPEVERPPLQMEVAELPGRQGYAERAVSLLREGDAITVKLHGWYQTTVDLNERQARFLRDTLNDWFPPGE